MYQIKLFKGFLVGIVIYVSLQTQVIAQFGQKQQWSADGLGLYKSDKSGIILQRVNDAGKQEVIISSKELIPRGKSSPVPIIRFSFSDDRQKVLIQTNTRKVWRYDTRGDYWVFDLKSRTFRQAGTDRPEASLMYAKFSPDATKLAYVSGHNLFVEDLSTGHIKQLTYDGTDRLINGTFDWAYEEEFDCRDGFRWSPDSKKIAFWQIDATNIRNYLMLNTTDSTYSFNIPVEYPKAGEDPSSCKIGVVGLENGKITWMDLPGDPVQHYIPRMEWVPGSEQIILQQLNRKQNVSKIFISNAQTGRSNAIYNEQDAAWIDIKARWSAEASGWEWINKGKNFIWLSEKDGWRHIYSINTDGKERLITKGKYDVITLKEIDEAGGFIYFMASPDNATQSYLYRVHLTGKGQAERISPASQSGTHDYEISPDAKIAVHHFSNSYTTPGSEVVSLPDHKTISGTLKPRGEKSDGPEFFKVKTSDGVEMDGWMVKPENFDPLKKYPVVFYVYSEPAAQTVTDTYGTGINWLYKGNMAKDGYIYISVENRGTPAPKGREWRKSIYKNIGILNIRDQAMAAKEILKWPYVDSSRVAVWGWSGGGSTTLNLMFQYPEIYKTGIAIAAVGNQLSYDNIYQERYMGLPQENKEVFMKGSPLTHAAGLKGNLLYIHGTGDDNVHYQNAELLINALVKYNKQFSLMSYPNRSHSISEGEGTRTHLADLYTNYLKTHCPPGGK